MEKKVARLVVTSQLLSAVLMCGGFAATAAAQEPTLEWHSDSLDLTFKYPGDLVRRDPEEAWKDGHLKVYGIPGSQLPELAQGTRCLRPLLELELPTSGGSAAVTEQKFIDGSTTVNIKPALLGTILVAELAVDCMTPEEQMKAHDLQTAAVDLLSKVPGMHTTMPPSMYTVGNQKVHAAGAQGEPKVQEDAGTPITPLQSYTMAFSTSWKNHLLVWYLSSNNTDVLNRMTKSTVKFGRSSAAPLYPIVIRYGR